MKFTLLPFPLFNGRLAASRSALRYEVARRVLRTGLLAMAPLASGLAFDSVGCGLHGPHRSFPSGTQTTAVYCTSVEAYNAMDKILGTIAARATAGDNCLTCTAPLSGCSPDAKWHLGSGVTAAPVQVPAPGCPDGMGWIYTVTYVNPYAYLHCTSCN